MHRQRASVGFQHTSRCGGLPLGQIKELAKPWGAWGAWRRRFSLANRTQESTHTCNRTTSAAYSNVGIPARRPAIIFVVAVAVAVRTRCPETPGEGAAKARPRSEGVDAASWAQHPRADADASVARDKSAVCMSAGRFLHSSAYARTNLSEWLKD